MPDRECTPHDPAELPRCADRGHESPPERIDVTPALAAEWLRTWAPNRRVDSELVRLYATDMANGNWRSDNGATICLGANGGLDGEHRLRAIVRSGCTIPLWVKRGVTAADADTIDNGRPRTFGYVLARHGEKNANQLAAILKLIGSWEQVAPPLAMGWVARRTSRPAMLAYLREHPEVREYATARGVRPMSKSIAGFCAYVFDRCEDGGQTTAEQDRVVFFDRLVNLTGFTEDDPIRRLRLTLDQVGEGQKKRGFQPRAEWTIAVVFKAWNAYRDGVPVKQAYKFDPGGSRPESFPIPH